MKFTLVEKLWLGVVASIDKTVGLNGGFMLPLGEYWLMKIGGLAGYNLGKLGTSQGVGYEGFLSYQYFL